MPIQARLANAVANAMAELAERDHDHTGAWLEELPESVWHWL